MATHRIVLTLSPEEITALDEIVEVRGWIELNNDFPEDVDIINNLYGHLREIRDRIKMEAE